MSTGVSMTYVCIISSSYSSIPVSWETVGVSNCTSKEILAFTDSWALKYNVFTHNCQHFSVQLMNYLLTAVERLESRGQLSIWNSTLPNVSSRIDCTECSTSSRAQYYLLLCTYLDAMCVRSQYIILIIDGSKNRHVQRINPTSTHELN